MSARLHLPHPHMPHLRLTEALLAGFAEGVVAKFQHHPAPIVPDGHDWDDWHYAPEQADWEAER